MQYLATGLLAGFVVPPLAGGLIVLAGRYYYKENGAAAVCLGAIGSLTMIADYFFSLQIFSTMIGH